jgi:DNA (cytosine-5)-methyltransferase 1
MEREGVTAAHLTEYYGNARDGLNLSDPLQTITARDREALTLAHLAHFKGNDKGQHPSDPLMSITAGDGQFAEIRTKVVKYDGQTDLKYWVKVRKLLNEYCDYSIADDEIILLRFFDRWYFIADISLRMLVPRELYDAMSFPHDYVIDRDINGNEIKRADQVAKCGNAVCPAVAEALVRANLSECPQITFVDMRSLHQAMVS